MRDTLPANGPRNNESLIVNMDQQSNYGTHWTCLLKRERKVYYFDSFGNLPPPLEVIRYLGPAVKIFYNTERYQQFNTYNCGHLCLEYLVNNS